MSTSQEIRIEVQTLREQYREVLLQASQKAAEGVLKYLPPPGERLNAIQAANVRWEMLQGGFSHREIHAILSKFNAIAENKGVYPTTPQEWDTFIDEKYLGLVGPETSRFTLTLLQMAWSGRLNNPVLNAHERAVFSIGKRINTILAANPADKDQIVGVVAKECGVQPEMVYRVATGGTRVTGQILMKMDRVVRRLEVTDE